MKIIGITDCEKYDNYKSWILSDPGVDVIRLGAQFSNSDEVRKCHGVLFTGGTDIHPELYGKAVDYPDAPEKFDNTRDQFEIGAFQEARKLNIPVLGVCRGLQLINCIFGGSLNQDLGIGNEIHRGGPDKMHSVRIEGGTFLSQITNVNNGEVNSSHHQSIDRLGENLVINSMAPDGKTIEGIEYDKMDQWFVLAVQWHPERMTNQNSPLTKDIRRSFLEAVKNF